MPKAGVEEEGAIGGVVAATLTVTAFTQSIV